MNKTLTSLVLSSGRFSGIVNPQWNRPTFTKISKFQISNQFSSFVMERNFFGGLTVSNSRFTNFLDTSISVATNYDITGKSETQHRTVYGHKFEIYILDSSFIHCESTASHGGALLFDRKTLAARIDRCAFQKCSTKKSGGAFYAIMDNLTVTRTCFDQCQALDSAHAFFVNLNTKLDTCNISEISICRCAKNPKPIGKSAALFLAGVHRAQLVNSTDNQALSLAAAFASLSSTNFTMTFCEIAGCSSMAILRYLDLNQSLVIAFCNFIGNKATVSLMQSSSRNNIINSVFIKNSAPSICSGLITYLQMSDCVMDTKYSFAGLAYIRTPNMIITKEVERLLINFAFGDGQCHILGPKEGIHGQNVIQKIIQSVPEDNQKYIQLFSERMSFVPSFPTPRDLVKQDEQDEINQEMPPPVSPRRQKPGEQRHKGKIIGIPSDEPVGPRKRDKQSHRMSSFGGVTPFVGGGRRVHDTNSKNVLPQVFTPSASFSPSETFYKSRTFLPSLQFTASVSPAQSLVPYVLYSAAGFVVFAVLTSFLFLKSSDAGYNLMTPSESADSRISDYASSTSTTVTVTGESSSVVV